MLKYYQVMEKRLFKVSGIGCYLVFCKKPGAGLWVTFVLVDTITNNENSFGFLYFICRDLCG